VQNSYKFYHPRKQFNPIMYSYGTASTSCFAASQRLLQENPLKPKKICDKIEPTDKRYTEDEYGGSKYPI
jgi:hypothetical protein